MQDKPLEQMHVRRLSNKRYRKLRNYTWRVSNFSLSSNQTGLSVLSKSRSITIYFDKYTKF